ncbi:hypothetical protein C0991_001806, partial [Blastosporella zonata]
ICSTVDMEAKTNTLYNNCNSKSSYRLNSVGLVYNHILKALICLPCGIALVSSEAFGHLKSAHKSQHIHIAQKDLDEIFYTLDLAATLPTLDLHKTHPEIPGLPVIKAIPCSQCGKLMGTQATLQKHYSIHHRGASKLSAIDHVNAQRLDNRFNAQLFEVVCADFVPPSASENFVRQLRADHDKANATDKGSRLDPRLVNPWLKSTRWPLLVKDRNIQQLIQYVALPNDMEFPGLAGVVGQLFIDTEGEFDALPELTLQWLNSPDPMKSGISNTPFHRHQDHPTRMKIYIRPILQLIAMLLRRPMDPPVFVLPSYIGELVTCFHSSLGKKQSDAWIMLKNLLMAIWTCTWVSTPEHMFTDPTIICLALTMVDTHGGFKHAKHTTGTIAQFEYCMRIVFMLHIHSQSTAKGSSYTHETDKLSMWFTEKKESTFNSLRSLQHRATAIALSTISLPRVYWIDRKEFRTMLFDGDEIAFSNIRLLFVDLEKRLVQSWKEHVLMGLDLHFAYGSICDDLTNPTIGYSFMSDPRNPFVSKRDWMMTSVIDSPKLRKKFIAFEMGNGHVEWNQVALRSWLFKYAQFESLLLVRAQMLGGSPGRGTEITAMTYKNIGTSTHRNCVVFGKYLAMLVTYHKGTSMTGTEKLIPHAFDGLTSDLIIQDLAIARPFAELAVHICYPGHASIRTVYRDHLFVNNGKLFTSENMTGIMQALTEPILGAQLGLAAWRQVSIAFKRKLSTSLEDLVEVDEHDTIQAQQASHSRWTENRIYGLSADSLSGVAEDVLPLYLDASTDWQIETKTVPGGLGLPYMQCMAKDFDALVSDGTIACTARDSHMPTPMANVKVVVQEMCAFELFIQHMF